MVPKPLVILEMCKNKKNETNPCNLKNDYGALKYRYCDHVPIFTDGSKEGNKVGYAVHTEYGDLTGALHGRASIFTAEARALTHALDWIKYQDTESSSSSLTPSPVCKLYCNTSPPIRLSEKSSRITLTLKRLEKK